MGLLSDPVEKTRRHALTALIKADPLALRPLCETLARDESPRIRTLALSCALVGNAWIMDLAADPDPFVRAAALQAWAPSDPGCGFEAIADNSPIVRQAALELTIEMSPDRGLENCIEAVIEIGDEVLLHSAISMSDQVQHLVFEKMSDASPRQSLTILKALALDAGKPVEPVS